MQLLEETDRRTNLLKPGRPRFVKSGAQCRARLSLAQSACIEVFKSVPQLSRFTLRDEGRTVAIGRVELLLG